MQEIHMQVVDFDLSLNNLVLAESHLTYVSTRLADY